MKTSGLWLIGFYTKRCRNGLANHSETWKGVPVKNDVEVKVHHSAMLLVEQNVVQMAITQPQQVTNLRITHQLHDLLLHSAQLRISKSQKRQENPARNLEGALHLKPSSFHNDQGA